MKGPPDTASERVRWGQHRSVVYKNGRTLPPAAVRRGDTTTTTSLNSFYPYEIKLQLFEHMHKGPQALIVKFIINIGHE